MLLQMPSGLSTTLLFTSEHSPQTFIICIALHHICIIPLLSAHRHLHLEFFCLLGGSVSWAVSIYMLRWSLSYLPHISRNW